MARVRDHEARTAAKVMVFADYRQYDRSEVKASIHLLSIPVMQEICLCSAALEAVGSNHQRGKAR